jgi:prolyl-tRNA editing enzyme YbaK/EbsC (Cys-tRNA(Pro) deacylase)
MNEIAYQDIKKLLQDRQVEFAELTHSPSKTSEESRAVRSQAGYPNAVGAKALLAKLYFKDGDKFATIVLPGEHLLDKDKLIAAIPDLKKIRFATPEEMLALAGVIPGCMPPFAAPIFPDIPILIVATAMQSAEQIGFNAAYLERSVILAGKDYFSAITPQYIVDCSVPK